MECNKVFIRHCSIRPSHWLIHENLEKLLQLSKFYLQSISFLVTNALVCFEQLQFCIYAKHGKLKASFHL